MAVRINPHDWQAIRVAYIGGESAKSIAQRFPIGPDSIYKKSSQERWRDSLPPTPAKIAAIDRLEAVAARIGAATRALEAAQ